MALSAHPARDHMADSLRGFAAILVIAGHLISRDIAMLPTPYWFLDDLTFIHMPLFFFFGGYFSLHSLRESLPHLLGQKALRLLLPYGMWSSVAVAAKTAAALLQGTFSVGQTLSHWGSTLLFAESMWFFVSLFIVHVAGWFLLRALDRWHAGALFLPLVLTLLPGSSIFAWHKTQEMLPFFVLGMLMARQHLPYRIDKLTPPRQAVLCLVALAVLTATPVYIPTLSAFRAQQGPLLIVCCAGEFFIFAAAMVLLCCLFSLSRPLLRVFGWLGRYSMQLYCLHMFFVKYFAVAAPSFLFAWPQAVSSVCYFALAFVVGTVCASLSWAVLDRIPLYRLLMLGQGPTAGGKTVP